MMTFIFIVGAPGVGKSTIAELLRRQLGSPLFEFGWIPEFRNTGRRVLSYAEDEALAFENLVMVAKNYARHGFKNIIITDLQNDRIAQLQDVFDGYDYGIFTLRQNDEALLKRQVMDETRSSGYRQWEEALRINRALLYRDPLPREVFIEVGDKSPDAVVAELVAGLQEGAK